MLIVSVCVCARVRVRACTCVCAPDFLSFSPAHEELMNLENLEEGESPELKNKKY